MLPHPRLHGFGTFSPLAGRLSTLWHVPALWRRPILPSLEIFCNIKKHKHNPLTKPFTRPSASTMQRGAAESTGTSLVAVNAMDQGQQCADCRRLVHCNFERTLSSITPLELRCVRLHPRDVYCVGSTESHTHMNSANPIAHVTKCGGCILICRLHVPLYSIVTRILHTVVYKYFEPVFVETATSGVGP